MNSAYTPSESIVTLPERAVLSREQTRIDGLPAPLNVIDAAHILPIGHAVPAATRTSDLADADSLNTLLDPNGLQDQTNYLPARMIIIVFLGISVSLSLAWLETTIVATALPSITSSLQGGKESSWVATAYLMSSLAFIPVFGRWSDIFGRKQMLMAALMGFFVFSIACALAQTMTQLIIFRALQGIGGGAIITVAIIIPNDIVSLRERPKYQGIIETVSVISNGCGPIIGGALSEYTSWRWAFWINLPLAALAILVTFFFLPLKPVRGDWRVKAKQVDYGGSGLTVVAAILVMLGINWGGVTYPWTSPQVLVPLILGIMTFAAFLGWEARMAKLPIVPLSVFRYRTLNGVLIASFLNGVAFITILFYLPQFLQLVSNKSPLNASLLLIPFLGTTGFSVIIAGLITTYTGGHYKAQIVVGYSCWAVAQGLLSTLNEQSSTRTIIGIMVFAGLSAGMTFQTQLLASQACIPRHEQAVVAGVRSFVRAGGTTIALAIDASIVNNILRQALNPLDLSPDQVTRLLNDPTLVNSASLDLSSSQRQGAINGYTQGFHAVFYMTTACMALAALVSLFMVSQHTLEREDDQAQEEKMREAERLRVERRRMSSVDARSAGDVEKGLGLGDARTEAREISASSGNPR